MVWYSVKHRNNFTFTSVVMLLFVFITVVLFERRASGYKGSNNVGFTGILSLLAMQLKGPLFSFSTSFYSTLVSACRAQFRLYAAHSCQRCHRSTSAIGGFQRN